MADKSVKSQMSDTLHIINKWLDVQDMYALANAMCMDEICDSCMLQL